MLVTVQERTQEIGIGNLSLRDEVELPRDGLPSLQEPLDVAHDRGTLVEVLEIHRRHDQNRGRLRLKLSEKLVEERVARAASEVVSHLETGSRVGLRSQSIRFIPATGFAHRSELLTFLAHVMPEPNDSARRSPDERIR